LLTLGSGAILRDKDLYLSGSFGHFGVALVSLNVSVRAPLVRMLSGQDITLSRIQRSFYKKFVKSLRHRESGIVNPMGGKPNMYINTA